MSESHFSVAADHSQVNGSIAEHLAAAGLLATGWKVYHQDHDSGPSDLVAEKSGKFERIQVKAFFVRRSTRRRDRKIACLCSTGTTKNGPRERDLRPLIEAFCVVDIETCTVIYIPSGLAPKTCIELESAKRIGTQLLPKC